MPDTELRCRDCEFYKGGVVGGWCQYHTMSVFGACTCINPPKKEKVEEPVPQEPARTPKAHEQLSLF